MSRSIILVFKLFEELVALTKLPGGGVAGGRCPGFVISQFIDLHVIPFDEMIFHGTDEHPVMAIVKAIEKINTPSRESINPED